MSISRHSFFILILSLGLSSSCGSAKKMPSKEETGPTPDLTTTRPFERRKNLQARQTTDVDKTEVQSSQDRDRDREERTEEMVKDRTREDQETTSIKGQGLTAIDQSNDQRDLELLQDIRQKLIESETLSLEAKNIIVITNEGNVYLKGAVEDQQEKKEVEQMVKKTKGVQNVVNLLEIEST